MSKMEKLKFLIDTNSLFLIKFLIKKATPNIVKKNYFTNN